MYLQYADFNLKKIKLKGLQLKICYDQAFVLIDMVKDKKWRWQGNKNQTLVLC